MGAAVAVLSNALGRQALAFLRALSSFQDGDTSKVVGFSSAAEAPCLPGLQHHPPGSGGSHSDLAAVRRSGIGK